MTKWRSRDWKFIFIGSISVTISKSFLDFTKWLCVCVVYVCVKSGFALPDFALLYKGTWKANVHLLVQG